LSDNSENDDAQKTEDPTPKRLADARKRGQVPLSREINNWLMLMAGTVLIATLASPVMGELATLMKSYIEHAGDLPQAPGGLSVILGEAFKKTLFILLLPLIILIAAAFLGPFLQVGPLFAPEVIKPDISKISPLKGLKRMFSTRALMEFAKGILKIGIIAVVGVVLLYPFYGQVEHIIGLPVHDVLDEMQIMIVRLLTGVLVVLLVVAVIDVVYQRMQHSKKMRMTKQEVKDEYKQTEGDPQVRAKLRQLRQEKAQQRMMQSVPEADVVITNPTHYSVALKYEPESMDAPVCVAKGLDDVALRIREVAKEHDVVIYEAPPLARVLYDTVEIDDIVPEEHYKAVAEVISYVFGLKGKLGPA
jgi:flagellar biosynthetic protein FlhB